ncbi:ribonuclease HII [bacterium]|nr:ribonuclease HII [bacterium]
MLDSGAKIVAGVDEVGRGPLAGPVVAAAVIIDGSKWRDSKSLTPKMREKLFCEILARAKAVSIYAVPPGLIDIINIRNASFLAMRNAVAGLDIAPEVVFVDGPWEIPGLKVAQRPVVGGDRKIPVIAAASIVAKVARDMLMGALGEIFRGYGFDHNMGYPTKFHYQALNALGPCLVHRQSFRIR